MCYFYLAVAKHSQPSKMIWEEGFMLRSARQEEVKVWNIWTSFLGKVSERSRNRSVLKRCFPH